MLCLCQVSIILDYIKVSALNSKHFLTWLPILFAPKQVRIISCEVDKEDTGISAEEAYVSIATQFGLTKKQGKAVYQNALHTQKKHDALR